MKESGGNLNELWRRSLLVGGLFLAALSATRTVVVAEPSAPGPAFACAEKGGQLFMVDDKGKVVWKYGSAKGFCFDLQVLPSGNLLFISGKHLMEVSRDKTIAFDFVADSELVSCQRLPDGNTLAYQGSAGKLNVISPTGEMLKEIQIASEVGDRLVGGLGHARALDNGNFLVAHYASMKVCEYDPAGKRVFELPIPGGAYGVARLKNGNTLISVTDKTKDAKLIEVDPAGKTVWEFSNADIKDDKYGKDPLKFLTGFHRLPNGNTLITNWLGHWLVQSKTLFPQIFEVTPDKKIVWVYENKAMTSIVAVQALIDEPTAPKTDTKNKENSHE